jgi:hypothetical protein
VTTTQAPGVAPGAPDPSQNTSADDGGPTGARKVLKKVVTSLTVIFACIGAVSTSGYTIKDDLVPYFEDLGHEDASYAIKNPKPGNGPVIVKRCTSVSVRVTGDVPDGHELWLGTDREGRKAVVEEMDPAGDGVYRKSVSIGRGKDHDQARELDVLLVDAEAADWLRSIKDNQSLYNVASGKWLPGVRVVARMDVQRDSATSELDCSGNK